MDVRLAPAAEMADEMSEAESTLNVGHHGAGDDCFGKVISNGGRFAVGGRSRQLDLSLCYVI